MSLRKLFHMCNSLATYKSLLIAGVQGSFCQEAQFAQAALLASTNSLVVHCQTAGQPGAFLKRKAVSRFSKAAGFLAVCHQIV